MAVGYKPGQGGVTYKPGPLGTSPSGVISGKLGSALAGGSSSGGNGGGSSAQQQSIDNEARRRAEELLRQKAAEEQARQEVERIARERQIRDEQLREATILSMQKRTVSNYGVPTSQEQTIYFQPTIYKKQTDTFTNPVTGQSTPIYETRYSAGAAAQEAYGKVEDRLATQEEFNLIQSQDTRAITQISSKTSSSFYGETKGNIVSLYNEGEMKGSNTLKSFGLTDKNLGLVGKYSTPSLFFAGIERLGYAPAGKAKEFSQGFVTGTLVNIRDKPILNVVTYGAGKGIGFAVGGAKFITSPLIKSGGKLSKSIGVFGKTGTIGLGTLYAGSITLSAVTAPSAYESGATIGIGLKDAFLFGKGYKSGGKPFVKSFKSIKTKPEFNFGTDIIQPVISERGQYELGSFTIKSITPEVKIYSDMPIKKALRNLGINNKISKVTLEKIIPSKSIIQVGQVITKGGNIVYGGELSQKVGSNLKYLNSLSGNQKGFNIKGFNKLGTKNPELTKLDIYNLKQLTGRFASTSPEYFKGYLEPKKIARLTVGKKEAFIRFPQAGKTTTRFATISSIEPIITAEGKFEIYKTRLSLKDITFANPRASGKTIKISGFSKVLEPKYIDSGVDSYKITGSNNLGLQLKQPVNKAAVKQSIASLTSAKASQAKDIISKSKAITSRANAYSTAKLQEFNRVNILPRYVGGGGAGTVSTLYQGNMVYEGEQYSNKFSSIPAFKSRSIVFEIPFSSSISKSISKNVNKEINKEISKEISKSVNKEVSKEISKQMQKQSQKVMQKQMQKLITKQTGGSSIGSPFRIKTGKNPSYYPSLKGLRKSPNSSGLFNVQVRRRGKFFNIGRATSLKSALNLGRSKVSGTLAATFRVGGSIKGLTTPSGFYNKPSKSGLLFIEKRGLRLKRGSGEIPEIQSYKRLSSRRKMRGLF